MKKSALLEKVGTGRGTQCKILKKNLGAFGTAVLYRELASDNLVVIKEINMIELTAAERQMALNEAQVLSILNHPNIIR